MILKFWPWWPRKWPLNLSSLKIRPVDFIVDYIFETSGFHWSKLAIPRLSCLEKFHLLAASEAGCWKNKHPKKVNKYSCKCARVSENVQLTHWINNTNLHHERYSRFLHAPRNTWCFIFVLTFFPDHFFFSKIYFLSTWCRCGSAFYFLVCYCTGSGDGSISQPVLTPSTARNRVTRYISPISPAKKIFYLIPRTIREIPCLPT